MRGCAGCLAAATGGIGRLTRRSFVNDHGRVGAFASDNLQDRVIGMGSVHRFRVSPAYQQVEVRDAGHVDYPQWDTGEERVLASAQCIVLATCSDLAGDVEIEVRVDAHRTDAAPGELVFEGELLTTGQGIVVGSSLTDLHSICLPIGWHPVRIYGDPPIDPSRLTVLFNRRPAGD